jgi:hypothetical protein
MKLIRSRKLTRPRRESKSEITSELIKSLNQQQSLNLSFVKQKLDLPCVFELSMISQFKCYSFEVSKVVGLHHV